MPARPPSVHIAWTTLDSVRSATFRGADGQILQPFTNYLDQQAEKRAKARPQVQRSATESLTYALREFAEHLALASMRLEDANDTILLEFRTAAYEDVKNNPISRGIDHQMKETVDKKLRHVYDFIFACQSAGWLPPGTLGQKDCRVTSSLVLAETRGWKKDVKDKSKYPQCFGESGTNNPGQHFATEDDLLDLEDFLWRSPRTTATMRNLLFLRVTDLEAFRRSSGNSLRASQFSKKDLASKKDKLEVMITPPVQKRGYSNSFKMPIDLAIQIADYVTNEEWGRAAILKACNVDERTAKGALFLSTTTGKPLSDGRWSKIFGDAFREMGAQKGTAVHAVRRGSGARRAEEEEAYLQERGIPVTRKAIVDPVAEFLGHASEEAQLAYRHIQGRRSESFVDRQARQIEKLKLAHDQLRTQMAADRDRKDQQLRSITEQLSSLKREKRAQRRRKSP